jgi:hypothetical protein
LALAAGVSWLRGCQTPAPIAQSTTSRTTTRVARRRLERGLRFFLDDDHWWENA